MKSIHVLWIFYILLKYIHCNSLIKCNLMSYQKVFLNSIQKLKSCENFCWSVFLRYKQLTASLSFWGMLYFPLEFQNCKCLPTIRFNCMFQSFWNIFDNFFSYVNQTSLQFVMFTSRLHYSKRIRGVSLFNRSVANWSTKLMASKLLIKRWKIFSISSIRTQFSPIW